MCNAPVTISLNGVVRICIRTHETGGHMYVKPQEEVLEDVAS